MFTVYLNKKIFLTGNKNDLLKFEWAEHNK